MEIRNSYTKCHVNFAVSSEKFFGQQNPPEQSSCHQMPHQVPLQKGTCSPHWVWAGFAVAVQAEDQPHDSFLLSCLKSNRGNVKVWSELSSCHMTAQPRGPRGKLMSSGIACCIWMDWERFGYNAKICKYQAIFFFHLSYLLSGIFLGAALVACRVIFF